MAKYVNTQPVFLNLSKCWRANSVSVVGSKVQINSRPKFLIVRPGRVFSICDIPLVAVDLQLLTSLAAGRCYVHIHVLGVWHEAHLALDIREELLDAWVPPFPILWWRLQLQLANA